MRLPPLGDVGLAPGNANKMDMQVESSCATAKQSLLCDPTSSFSSFVDMCHLQTLSVTIHVTMALKAALEIPLKKDLLAMWYLYQLR
jgi:hypothetical protein